MENIISIKNLCISFNENNEVVRDININILEGKTIAIVGESGSGKTLSALSILKLLPSSAKITKGEIIYMDHIHTPEMSVAKGVQISSCVPFIFKPVSYNNDLFIDGGLIKNLDLDMFTEFEVHTLALEISDFKNINVKNLSTYGLKVFMLVYNEANRIKNNNEKYLKILSIPEDKLESFNFKLSKHDLDYLKLVGKNSVQSIF